MNNFPPFFSIGIIFVIYTIPLNHAYIPNKNLYKTCLENYDVTPVQYGVLYCLWKGDKTTPKEIASELKLENSTISGILDRMEKKDLLKRQVSTEDRRYIEVVLTEKGASLEKPVLDTIDQANLDILASIPEEEQQILKKNLRLLAGLEEN